MPRLFRSSLPAPLAVALAIVAAVVAQAGFAPASVTAERLAAASPPGQTRSGAGDESPVVGAVVAERSVARYRVREQLAGLNFPNDAVGETRKISGTIALTSDAKIIPGRSRIVVDLRDLSSDETRRDRYLQRNTLATERFPTASLVVREVRGLAWPPPAGGAASFQIMGDLTVRDRTRPTTWDVTARFTPEEVTGTATTALTFAELGLAKPRVMSVLSVDDTIRLEIDFAVARERDET